MARRAPRGEPGPSPRWRETKGPERPVNTGATSVTPSTLIWRAGKPQGLPPRLDERQYAMAFVKFDASTDPAQRLKADVLKKLQEVWDPQLEDDAIAQYTLALISRGPDRKKVHAQLHAVLGEETTTELLNWCATGVCEACVRVD